MKLLTQHEIRTQYTDTLDKAETILERWRHGNATEREQQCAWVLLSDIVYTRAKRHYKQAQPYGRYQNKRDRMWYELGTLEREGKYVAHTERMLMLADFLRKHKHRSIGWCYVSYRMRFPEFEMERELRQLGISLDNFETEEKGPFPSKSSFLRFGILIRKIQREYLEIYDAVPTPKDILLYWQQREGNTKKQYSFFLARYLHYLRLFESVNGTIV